MNEEKSLKHETLIVADGVQMGRWFSQMEYKWDADDADYRRFSQMKYDGTLITADYRRWNTNGTRMTRIYADCRRWNTMGRRWRWLQMEYKLDEDKV